MGDDALTPEQAAERLHVNPETIRRMLRKGELPGFRVGRVWRIASETIDRMQRGEDVKKKQDA